MPPAYFPHPTMHSQPVCDVITATTPYLTPSYAPIQTQISQPIQPKFLTGRTVDEMYTITPAGFALAAAMAVDQLASVLQHAQGYVAFPLFPSLLHFHDPNICYLPSLESTHPLHLPQLPIPCRQRERAWSRIAPAVRLPCPVPQFNAHGGCV